MQEIVIESLTTLRIEAMRLRMQLVRPRDFGDGAEWRAKLEQLREIEEKISGGSREGVK